MINVDIIRNAVFDKIGKSSARDRAAYKIAQKELSVVKDGRYYVLTLFGRSEKIYANTRYIGIHIDMLLHNNELWHKAKAAVRAKYHKEKLQ